MKLKFFFRVLIASAVLAVSLIHSSLPVFNEEVSINLPILMYHSVVKNPEKSGKYVITPEKFEEDLLYLKNKGYTSISAKQLIQYVYNNAPLPEKPVMITFDDGMYNNLEYVLPLLEKYNCHAIFSIVGSYTDEYSQNNIVNPLYSYLRWSDIQNLSDSPYVEFGNHSYDFHSISSERYGTEKKKSENSLEYINIFYQDTEKMQTEFLANCAYRPVVYTYPFGSYSSESSRVLKKMGFLITLSCFEGTNQITHDPECLYLLKRYNRSGVISSYRFFSKIKM